jgi:MYXO-CTERM domain-containing protein
VVFNATVGAFDVVVLQGGTSSEVIAWLDANQYQQNPLAQPILDDYLSKGYLFVALKLTGGAGVDEIHPIVIKYAGDTPCVPIKLTAIAATEDMEVRTFFLGKGRVVPTNYKHLVLNQARVDWTAATQTFLPAVTAAANEPVANGHGFVTEYAGPNFVSQGGLYNSQWDASAYPGLKPEQLVPTLQKQGLVSCSGGATCTFYHPLIEGLMHEFLPPPAGVNDAAYYGCVACYLGQADLSSWDGAAFGKALIERVIQPGVHAQSLLQTWPYVTRMLTTLSPAEMTEDPEFHEDDSLPPDGAKLFATRQVACNGQSAMVLPGGRTIALVGGAWPAWDATMPWVDLIEEYPLKGAPIVLVDNTKKIDAEVAAWTQSQGWPPAQPTCPGTGGSGGGSGGKSGAGGGGGAGAGGKGGAGGGGGKGGVAGASGVGAGGTGGGGGQAGSEPSAGGGAGKGLGGGTSVGKGGTGGAPTAGGAGKAGTGGITSNGGASSGGMAGAPVDAATDDGGGGGCAVGGATSRGLAPLGAMAVVLAALRRRRSRRSLRDHGHPAVTRRR